VKLLIRSAKSDYGRLPALARELIDAKVEVIVAVNTPGARAAVDATKTIPVVVTVVGDPIGSGLVSNLSRPGGNVTGLSNMSGELGPKRLALFNELVPAAKRIAVLYNPIDPVTVPQTRDIRRAAPKLGVEVRFFPVKSSKNLPESFRQMLAWRAQSAIWLQGQSVEYEPATIEWAARHRLPVMVSARAFVEAGGLLSYVADTAEILGRTAIYVDKILKGAKAGDLPVEQPTKFDLVVNRKTAKALGLTIPNSILVQATKVIE
jgi:putative ABC transport system substrate-binding protein